MSSPFSLRWTPPPFFSLKTFRFSYLFFFTCVYESPERGIYSVPRLLDRSPWGLVFFFSSYFVLFLPSSLALWCVLLLPVKISLFLKWLSVELNSAAQKTRRKGTRLTGERPPSGTLDRHLATDRKADGTRCQVINV